MKKALLCLLFFIPQICGAQDDLLDLLGKGEAESINYSSATFKSTRIMNGHSIERMPGGQLDFRISHRFGKINSGIYELFGLDQSSIHFSLEYGIADWLMIGAGRGSYEKTYDGFAKFTLLRQSSGARNMPVTLSFLSSVAATSMKSFDPAQTNSFLSRLSYVNQILVARKISPALSVQLSPALVHRNRVISESDPNNLYAIGTGGRIKLTRRISLNAEYYYIANRKDNMSLRLYNPFSAGFDVETGGHVFQLIFTNSLSMIEKGFIGETTGSWGRGDIHFGFNISRVFTLK